MCFMQFTFTFSNFFLSLQDDSLSLEPNSVTSCISKGKSEVGVHEGVQLNTMVMVDNQLMDCCLLVH